jgi:hypothetical protein
MVAGRTLDNAVLERVGSGCSISAIVLASFPMLLFLVVLVVEKFRS